MSSPLVFTYNRNMYISCLEIYNLIKNIKNSKTLKTLKKVKFLFKKKKKNNNNKKGN